MSAVFLLGAGASFGSGDCSPCPPPLGKELFSKLVARGGIAATVEGTLRDLFLHDFEQGMAQFRLERDVDTTTFLREMAIYFAEFSAGPANHLHRLTKAIRGSRRRSVIATTNYDLLLEGVIEGAGMRYDYRADHVPCDIIPLLKIHGSCNFLPSLAGGVMRGFKFSKNGANYSGPVTIARNGTEVARYCRTQDSLAPAISLYAAGKDVLFCPDIVRRQQVDWANAAVKARTIYVIGLRVARADDHIWSVLANSDAAIEYVGLEPNDFMDWAASAGRRRIHVLEQTLEHAIPLIEIQLRH